jgi:hypothetical protein
MKKIRMVGLLVLASVIQVQARDGRIISAQGSSKLTVKTHQNPGETLYVWVVLKLKDGKHFGIGDSGSQPVTKSGTFEWTFETLDDGMPIKGEIIEYYVSLKRSGVELDSKNRSVKAPDLWKEQNSKLHKITISSVGVVR